MPHPPLEEECVRLCRAFCICVTPVEVLPPGGVAKYNEKQLDNYTDLWLLRRRMFNERGEQRSASHQRMLFRDRTAETLRALSKAWKLFAFVLVSLHESSAKFHED